MDQKSVFYQLFLKNRQTLNFYIKAYALGPLDLWAFCALGPLDPGAQGTEGCQGLQGEASGRGKGC